MDAGSNALAVIPFTSTLLTTDQRGEGFVRPIDVPGVGTSSDRTVDIGAHEVNLPKVISVIVSSTLPTSYVNPVYDFNELNPDGTARVGSGTQLKTVDVGRANRIGIRFSEDVSVTASDFQIIAVNRVVALPSMTFEALGAGNNLTASWTFTSTLATPELCAQYLIRVRDSVTNSFGALDGEWINPGKTSTMASTNVFPSGNGTAGGHFEFVFGLLPGDMNRDSDVNFTDLSGFGQALTDPNSDPSLDRMADVNGDGGANFSDNTPFSNQVLHSLNQQTLTILGDYDMDHHLTNSDVTQFNSYFMNGDPKADLDGNGMVESADQVAFDALRTFGINLTVVV
jgi:hypothetical protein